MKKIPSELKMKLPQVQSVELTKILSLLIKTLLSQE